MQAYFWHFYPFHFESFSHVGSPLLGGTGRPLPTRENRHPRPRPRPRPRILRPGWKILESSTAKWSKWPQFVGAKLIWILYLGMYLSTCIPGPSHCGHCCPPLHCTALHCTALHCSVLHYTALHCTTLHCSVLHCTALHCIALYCTGKLNCNTL